MALHDSIRNRPPSVRRLIQIGLVRLLITEGVRVGATQSVVLHLPVPAATLTNRRPETLHLWVG